MLGLDTIFGRILNNVTGTWGSVKSIFALLKPLSLGMKASMFPQIAIIGGGIFAIHKAIVFGLERASALLIQMMSSSAHQGGSVDWGERLQYAIGLANYLFPVDFLIINMVLLFELFIFCLLYRLVKSYIPTLS